MRVSKPSGPDIVKRNLKTYNGYTIVIDAGLLVQVFFKLGMGVWSVCSMISVVATSGASCDDQRTGDRQGANWSCSRVSTSFYRCSDSVPLDLDLSRRSRQE